MGHYIVINRKHIHNRRIQLNFEEHQYILKNLYGVTVRDILEKSSLATYSTLKGLHAYTVCIDLTVQSSHSILPTRQTQRLHFSR